MNKILTQINSENKKTVFALTFAAIFTMSLMFAPSATMAYAGGPGCDAKNATIYKREPGNDSSNTFVVNNVDVEMERWDKDDSGGAPDANEGWIIKGTGNKRVPLQDVIKGSHLDDKITPGWGSDTVCAGDGDDLVQGGWGDDRLFGEAGDDLLKGGWGDDHLDGGSDTDEAQGGKNTDTCIAEISNCEA